MNNIFILLLIILTSCNNKINQIKKNTAHAKKLTSFIPDITINNKIILLESLRNIDFIKEKEIYYIKEDTVIIMNRTHNQKLTLLRSYGGDRNEFGYFEISYDTINNTEKYNKSTFEYFETENKIKLGIRMKDVITIKGDGYSSIKEGDVEVIEYKIDNYLTSDFLKRYNSPIYNAIFTFKDEILVKYSFGFEMP